MGYKNALNVLHLPFVPYFLSLALSFQQGVTELVAFFVLQPVGISSPGVVLCPGYGEIGHVVRALFGRPHQAASRPPPTWSSEALFDAGMNSMQLLLYCN